MTPSPIDRPLSRRALLRGASVAGAGALAAYTVGCGDGGGGASPTATAPDVTPTSVPAGAATPYLPASASWQRVEPEGETPGARRDHSIVADGEALYVFGGRARGTNLADLWVFGIRSNTWEERAVEGSPSARFGHNAVWEPISGTMIIFGGQADASAFFNDLWRFNPSGVNWGPGPNAPAFAPAARYGAAGAVDPGGNFLVTHGFTTAGRFDDSWAWESNAWLDITPDGPKPSPRCLMRAVYDSERARLLMFGGQSTGAGTPNEPFLNDLWELAEDGWYEITSQPKPSPRTFYSMTSNDEAGVVILFGGNSAEGELNDVWAFDVREEVWTQIERSGEGPSPRQGHDAARVPGQGLYVFGGNDGSSDLNDLWLLTLS